MNRLLQSMKLGLGGIAANKMRSFLTMLGVIIGVAAVITLVSLGRGATDNVSKQIEGMGSNLVIVNLVGRDAGTTLSYDECMNLANKQGVGAVSPTITGSVTTKYGDTKYDTSLEGITPEYSDVRDENVQAGRFINELDVEYDQPVVLLGTTVSGQLFPGKNPVGNTIRINGLDFKVVGLLESKGGTALGSSDDKVLIPFTTAEKLLGNKIIRSVYIKAQDANSVNQVVYELNNYLMSKFNSQSAFTVFNQQDALSTLDSVTSTLTLLLSAIAGISLLVGGIGIMNIMLVSVTERTREIGIRKAIGAKRKNVLSQFLIEAMAISGTGGIIGILIGMGLTSLIGGIMNIAASASLNIIVIAFLFSLLVGIAFGIYPASRASKLNPIDALRFE